MTDPNIERADAFGMEWARDVLDYGWTPKINAALAAEFAKVREEERERCARVAEGMSPMVGHLEGVHDPNDLWPGCRLCIAAAIRAGKGE